MPDTPVPVLLTLTSPWADEMPEMLTVELVLTLTSPPALVTDRFEPPPRLRTRLTSPLLELLTLRLVDVEFTGVATVPTPDVALRVADNTFIVPAEPAMAPFAVRVAVD